MSISKQLAKNIDWKSLLLTSYRDLLLNEEQVMIILMCDYCINNGERLVTPDILSLKMSLDFKKIDNLLTGLMEKGLVTIVDDEKHHPMTSIDNLIALLTDLFITNCVKAKKAVNEEANASLFSTFENRFGRPLSYIEIETIQSWLEEGNSEQLILSALDEAIAKKVKNIRYIDQIILNRRQAEEVSKEGYTTITNKWRSNIEETSKIANLDWVDKHDNK